MKKISWGLIAALILLPVISFAQTNSQNMLKPPASWIAFQKKEHAKQAAFLKQIRAETDAFINANPDVKAYVERARAAAKARMEKWWRTVHKK